MSDQQPAAVVAREARSIHAGLKVLLARDVWGNYREADFQRKNLRRQYLHLLLLHPTAREARDVGTHLWMQTSYAFIALYKQRLQVAPRQHHQHNNNNNNNNANSNHNNNNNGGPVETRKLLQRFRQFLADEERFWRALVLRVQRAYKIVLPPNVSLPPELLGSGANNNEEEPQGQGAEDSRMNHFGFPAHAADALTLTVDARTAASVLSKALVCLGDIARYREQYKVPPGANGKGGKFGPGKGKMYLGEPRPNFSRPRALYLAAHALSPGEGNAAHQLAILAGYEQDTLASVAWYLRALCVRAPFETAGENLAGVLARALAAHRQQQHQQGKLKAKNGVEGGNSNGAEGGGEDGEKEKAGGKPMHGWETGDMDGGESEELEERDPPRVRIDRFRRELVLLHALWRDGSTPAPQTLALAAHTARAFARLVSARALPEDLIVRVVLVAQGAVWVGRMLAPPPAKNTGSASGSDKEKNGEKEKEKGRRANRYTRANRNRDKSAPAPADAAPPADAAGELNESTEDGQRRSRTQAAHLAHLLGLHTALLGVGVRELGEVDVYAVPAPAPAAAAAAVNAPQGTARGGFAGGGRGGKGKRGGRRGGEAPVVSAAVPVPATGAGGGTGKPELAERISAEFRRTLPALRVASKKEGEGGGERGGRPSAEEVELGAQRERFWATYAEFLRRLARTFPAGLLPKLSASGGEGEGNGAVGHEGGDGDAGKEEVEVELELELEEDVDMRGWLPLRELMGGPCPLPPNLLPSSPSAGAAEETVDEAEKDKDMGEARRTVGLREEVHPNVEQLMRIADLLRDARRVVGLEGSPLALYGGQFVVKGVEAAKPAAGVVPPAPVFTHQPPRPTTTPLASIRARALRDDLDDDVMTEQTDDDILHDAFSFLNRAGSESEAAEEASDEDEIVWDLRHACSVDAPVSPVVPTARTSPKTPVRLPPIGTPGRGAGPFTPGSTAPQLSPFRVPQALSQPQPPITTGTQIPSTTALDLLNTFAKKPVAVLTPPAGVPAVGMGGGASDGMLFGSRPAAQSIWSASRDERGLMFAGGGGGSGGGVGQQQQQQQQLAHQHTHSHAPQYQGLPQSAGLSGYAEQGHGHSHGAHHRFASQDLMSSQGSTIWASSYPSASQHHVPTTGFGHPPPTHLSPTHQRVVSNSMAAAQLFPSGGDQYGYGPLSAPPPQYVGGMPPEEQGVFYATSGQGFAAQQQGHGLGQAHGHGPGPGHGHGQHARHLSLDPRAAVFHGHGQPMSQLLGNVG
ncbi:hypothetical protein MVEN_02160100 [Mycena venus]|uniref:DNA/RNA-binding domain-containing protein n=1 Tax=Mycena venus TaxID=2733690 RepID=A0A8H7CFV1_9AGAR|nr:hypothetical protein MVEN_02160100 [Mycena venus]